MIGHATRVFTLHVRCCRCLAAAKRAHGCKQLLAHAHALVPQLTPVPQLHADVQMHAFSAVSGICVQNISARPMFTCIVQTAVHLSSQMEVHAAAGGCIVHSAGAERLGVHRGVP